jgi:cytochrome c oxidase assembly protein subunit 15
VSETSTYRPTCHWLAWGVALATFPLIFMGGLVTTHNAGMSVPDWPNSYGYNMFLLPWDVWKLGGIFYEHTHRLLGTLAGFMAVTLALHAWGPARRPRVRKTVGWLSSLLPAGVLFLIAKYAAVDAGRIAYETGKLLGHVGVGLCGIGLTALVAWTARQRHDSSAVRWLAIAVLAGVIGQGVLGGLRVLRVDLDLAILHGIVAQLFFCLATLAIVVTSRWWERVVPLAREIPQALARRVAVCGGVTVLLILTQLVIGAVMRHNNAGLAIPDLPLAYGRLIPPTDPAELPALNAERARILLVEKNVPYPGQTTLEGIWLHFGHRVGAVVVSIAVISLLAAAFRLRSFVSIVLWSVVSWLLVGQFTLGVLTVYFGKPAEVASLHVACGALLLASTFALTVRSARLAWVAKHRETVALATPPGFAILPGTAPIPN